MGVIMRSLLKILTILVWCLFGAVTGVVGVQAAAPTVTTTTITAITSTTATSGGNVTDDGGDSVTARGVCWSTFENPTTDDFLTSDGSDSGAFVSSITGLDPATMYYVRAYATNTVGTSYGDNVTFTTLQIFTISGHVWTSDSTGIDSVVMDGFPGIIETDTGGDFTAYVDSGWSGVVKPAKDCYVFDPESTSYSSVTTNQVTDYSGTFLTYLVFGHVWTADMTGIDSVTMIGLPGDPQTDTSGYYIATVDCGWSGVVTPTKDGYTFDPESTSYSDVSDNQNTSYIGIHVTYTISGHVWTSDSTGIDSVVMDGFPGIIETDTDGDYTAYVDSGWSGVVTPVKDGYTFDPESTSYSNVTDNQENDYTGTLLTYTISGYIHRSLKTGVNPGIDSVTMNGLPGDPLTDSSGYYTATVDYGWSGVVTPDKNCYTFDPESTSYSDVTDNQETDYTGTFLTYTISGHVWTSDSTGIDSVTMSGFPGDPSTDSTGYYTATVDCGWTGVVKPTKDGYTFDPESTSYSDVTDDQETDYIGTLFTYTISGYVFTSDSTGIEDVVMSGLLGDPQTDSEGYYTATVPYGWSGTVKPVHQYYSFDPESTSYNEVTDDQQADYTGTFRKVIISGYVLSDGEGVEGVVMNGLPGDPQTDDSGYYAGVVDTGWCGVVIPTSEDCLFLPEDIVYIGVNCDQTDQNYEEECFSEDVDQDKNNMVPKDYMLAQNHPNPFNPSTEIMFGLPKAGFVTLKIYNILGQELTTLINRSMSAGIYRVIWNGTDRSGRAVSSGVYFYRMQSGDFSQTKEMLLLK
jgi:hypothetical protein